MCPTRVPGQHRRWLLRCLWHGRELGRCGNRRCSAELRPDCIGSFQHRHQPPRARATWLGQEHCRQPADVEIGCPPGAVATRRRSHRHPVGSDPRPASSADGPAGSCGGEEVLRGLPERSRPCSRWLAWPHQGLLPEVPHPVRLRSQARAGGVARRAVRDRRLPRPRWDGLDPPGPRPQRERSLGRRQGPAQRRRPRCVPCRRRREAVPRRGRAPGDRRDLQLRLGSRRGVVHHHGVRRGAVVEQPAQVADEAGQGRVLAVAGRPGDGVHHRGATRVLVPARPRFAVLRLQAGQRDPSRRRHQVDRPGRGAPDR
ncbi:MAG: hypothetical protein FD127_3964 [Acidimicrobiaceae bacterium]|nr:MAG: hypothetical protein FD127_3964 [Acidimicrobiaceae bacterium]